MTGYVCFSLFLSGIMPVRSDLGCRASRKIDRPVEHGSMGHRHDVRRIWVQRSHMLNVHLSFVYIAVSAQDAVSIAKHSTPMLVCEMLM